MKTLYKALLPIAICLLIGINYSKAQIAWPQNGTSIYYNEGNVGIGTTSPIEKLHVNGGNIILAQTAGQTPFRISSYSNSSSLWFLSGNATTSTILLSPNYALDFDRGVQFSYTPGTTGAAAGYLRIGQQSKNNANWTHGITQFYTNGVEQVRIAANGNVGIGTTSPSAKLEVLSGTSNNEIARFGGTLSARGLKLSSFAVGGTNEVGFNFNAPGAGGAAAISFSTLSTERMRINYNGNVGIGTSTPNNRLEINHGIVGNSGLRFTQLTSSSAASAGNGKFLSVNSTGDVILTDAGSLISTWGMHGNSGTNPTTDFIGTTDEKDFVIKTNNVQRIRVSSSGNISFVNPLETSAGIYSWFKRIETTNDPGSWMTFMQGTETESVFGNDGDLPIKIGNNTGYHKLVILNNGNIGVGTSNPSSKLCVHASADGSLISGITTYASYAKIFEVSQEASDGFLYLRSALGKTNIKLSGSASTPSYFLSNVAIGTINPGNYKLAVEGIIGAREIKVTLDTWSDFVFNTDYKLRSLNEVEHFIKTNKHLPEIPSEKEVKEQGISLGEMNAKLLQKIEELTLYMIELKKGNDDLRKRIELVENKR